jgi:hypothetical protein
MESEIRYRGYLKVNNYKEYFELDKDNKWIFKVYADHMYIKRNKIDTYLKDGSFYKTISEDEYFNKQCIEEIEQPLGVVQINYEFHLMPIGYISTVDEIESLTTKLNNSFNKKFDTEITTEPSDSSNLYKSIRKPYEVNRYGHSRHIQSLCMDFILNLNMKEYRKRKDKFIKTLTDEYLINQCEYIFKLNVSNLKAYFMCSERELFSKNFNLFNNTLNRLNYNINQKQRLRL